MGAESLDAPRLQPGQGEGVGRETGEGQGVVLAFLIPLQIISSTASLLSRFTFFKIN